MTTTSTESAVGSRWPILVGVFVLLSVLGCHSPSSVEQASARVESWTVTAWGKQFEVFPEVGVLVAGQTAMAHVHVTRLADFAPLATGTVEIVLVDPSGEQVFSTKEAARPGVFNIELTPARSGEADLYFRIRDAQAQEAQGMEEVRGGRVRVGTSESPGKPVRIPAPRGASDGGEPQEFIKEQQWKSTFATNWVRQGRLAQSVMGSATFRPPAGGESVVTAPLNGVVHQLAPGTRAPGTGTWPYVGQQVEKGAVLFRVVPLVAVERSLATLEAEWITLKAELKTAQARLGRLEELLTLEAISQKEVEEARVQVENLKTSRQAAERDLESARSARGAGGGARSIPLKAPFSGQIAAVATTPGATVAAGDSLARLVRTDPIWIEVALAPQDARKIAQGIRGLVLEDPEAEPLRIEEGLSLVSVAPEVSPRTGTVTVLLEAPSTAGFALGTYALGTTVNAQLLGSVEQTGIVIPASALVDDGGVPVVYLQLSGESFVRQEVTVLVRQGDLLLVDGLIPGQRLVTLGGNVIRRASLMSSGVGHGHEH